MDATVLPMYRISFAGALVTALLVAGCAGTPPASVATFVDTRAADEGEARVAPYGPEVAARFPPPPVRYITPGLLQAAAATAATMK